MKSILILLSLALLTGCSTAPVKRNFPEAPKELLTQCPDLLLLPTDTDKLSTMLNTVAENYSLYHECRIKNDTWIEWYKTQKQIFDKVK